MSRSHPPSLARRIESTLKRECNLPWDAGIGVAVSGGPDSMALCHVLAQLSSKLGFRLAVLTIDHGLRPEAADEVSLVGEFCDNLGIPWESTRLNLSAGANLQERARTLRYGALWKMNHRRFGPEAFLATAHHKEDRAETVLLRILRGTSLEGISVLPPRSERLLRPMIRADKASVLAHVDRHNLSVCWDPSNRDPRFLRVRIRRELLPMLRELSPGVDSHLVELADDAARLPDALGLNREQRDQIRRALREPKRKVDLPLGGGLRISREIPPKKPKE